MVNLIPWRSMRVRPLLQTSPTDTERLRRGIPNFTLPGSHQLTILGCVRENLTEGFAFGGVNQGVGLEDRSEFGQLAA